MSFQILCNATNGDVCVLMQLLHTCKPFRAAAPFAMRCLNTMNLTPQSLLNICTSPFFSNAPKLRTLVLPSAADSLPVLGALAGSLRYVGVPAQVTEHCPPPVASTTTVHSMDMLLPQLEHIHILECASQSDLSVLDAAELVHHLGTLQQGRPTIRIVRALGGNATMSTPPSP